MASSTFNVLDGYGSWDANYNRPIVGGKVTNPTTGEIEEAGPMLTPGPPSIDAIWVNITPGYWRTSRFSLSCPIDKVFFEVSLHIQQGVYTIESLNATAYSIIVVCRSKATRNDFSLAIKTMRTHLHGREVMRPEVWEGDILPASGVEGALQEVSKVGDDAGALEQ